MQTSQPSGRTQIAMPLTAGQVVIPCAYLGEALGLCTEAKHATSMSPYHFKVLPGIWIDTWVLSTRSSNKALHHLTVSLKLMPSCWLQQKMQKKEQQ